MDNSDNDIRPVQTINPDGQSNIVLVCEHASAVIPPAFGDLGLSDAARISHIAWDPGALAVSHLMADRMDATLVAGGVSRLIYDCNRPPEAPDAIPQRSEVFDVPGNAGLSEAERRARYDLCYLPFHADVARVMAAHADLILVTIHSFTPVYQGQTRRVEVGVLHDTDARFADAMLHTAPENICCTVERNAPYGPQDGVTHTLRKHALPQGRLNVMLEIRNNLIATPEQQADMALRLTIWLRATLEHIGRTPCRA